MDIPAAEPGNEGGEQQNRKRRLAANLATDLKIELPSLKPEVEKFIYDSHMQKVKLSEKQLPSVAVFKMLNTYKQLTAVTISEQSNYVVCGFEDSLIKVFDLRAGHTRPNMLEEQRLKELQQHFDPKSSGRGGPIQ